jgi:hypothetical protein
MQTRTSSFQIHPDPDFATFLKEIANRLCNDDWERWSTSGGEFVYYVIGAEARQIHSDRAVDFDPLFPLPSDTDQQSKWFARAQIAAKQPDYLLAARTRLRELGISDVTVEAMLELRVEELKGLRLAERPELLDALSALLRAAVLARGLAADSLDSDELRRVARDRKKIYLREVAKKYADIIRRVGELEALKFSNPQLEEASRCYLYGFHRAAVVLAAAAVETHLKRITGKDWFAQYAELTEAAFWAGKLDGAHRDAATKLFTERRKVVHHAHHPTANEAADALALARDVVAGLQE